MASQLPPTHLAQRVGSLDPKRFLEHYESIGRTTRAQILGMLPEDWSFEGKRVLDFGCGAGRTLQHFLEEAQTAEIWGCDIDAESVDWLEQAHSPPLRLSTCGEPPLDHPDGHFDLIWAISVFTHLSDDWSAWMAEMQRLLADGGLLIATFIGDRMSDYLLGEPWDGDRVGMNVVHHWQSWDAGGPTVLHADWWIEAHWGRAFEVVEIDRTPHVEGELSFHSWALLRRRARLVSAEELERPEPGEAREWSACRHNLDQVRGELELARATIGELKLHREKLEGEIEAQEKLLATARREAELTRREAELTRRDFEATVSWRVTRPLRAARRLLDR